jgi:hypothetical protein
MKKLYLLGIAIILTGIQHARAQYQAPDCEAIEAILIERYYVSDANDASDSDGGELAVGSVTYRVFVDMKPGYILESVFGNAVHPLSIESTSVFFNNQDRGENTGDAIASNRLGDNTVALDSYLTFNAASDAHLAVLKTEDNDGSIVGGDNNDGGSEGIDEGLLLNFTDAMELMLTEADGLIDGTIVSAATGEAGSVGTIGISDLSVFGDENVGNEFVANNGAWFVLGGVAGPTASNRVLIAQLTTAGTLDLKLNMRLGIPSDLQCTSPQCHESMDFFFFLTEQEQAPSIQNDRLCPLPEVTFSNGVVSTYNEKAPPAFFGIYPNPSSEHVILTVDPKISGEVGYQMFDLYGRSIKQGVVPQGNGIEVLELNGLANGVYILTATYQGQRSSKKLIKR